MHAGQVAPDHFAAAVSVHLRFKPNGGSARASQSLSRRYDEEAMAKPEGHAVWTKILDDLPIVPWHVSADEHASILMDSLQGALHEHFPPPGPRRRRRHTFL